MSPNFVGSGNPTYLLSPRFHEESKCGMNAPADPNSRALWEEANRLLFAGDEREALRFVSRVMVESPEFPDAWIVHILIAFALDAAHADDAWVARALAIHSSLPVFHALRVVAYARSGRIAEARERGAKLCEQNPNEANVVLARAYAVSGDGKRPDESAWRSGLALIAVDDWRTPLLWGRLQESDRQNRLAIHAYEAAIARNRDFPYAWYRKALSHAKLGENRAARNALANAELLCGENEKLRLLIAGTIIKPKWLKWLGG